MVQAAALAGFRDGDLIGIGAVAGGLQLTGVERISATPGGLAEQVRTLMTTDGVAFPVMFEALVEHLCLANPDLFTQPLAPLSDLFADLGFEHWGAFIGPVGFDFETWARGDDLEELLETYELTEDQAVAVQQMTRYFGRAADLADRLDRDGTISGQAPVRVGEANPALADPGVAEAFFWETVGIGVDEAAVMLALTEVWSSAAPTRVRPALAWLQGKSHERLGEVSAAEADFERSLGLDPFFTGSMVDLARYSADRGDAARAIALLERAGFTDEYPLLANLRPYQPAARADLGRNDPCWCGSRRKYKRCHLGKAEITAIDRARWLRQKIKMFALEPPQAALLLEMAAIRTEHLPRDPEAAVDDPVVLDVTLYEGGVLADFARIRGELLPTEERTLLGRWLAAERSVFEITDISVGRGVSLRDVRLGSRHQLLDDLEGVALSRSTHVGDLLLSRLLAVGDLDDDLRCP